MGSDTRTFTRSCPRSTRPPPRMTTTSSEVRPAEPLFASTWCWVDWVFCSRCSRLNRLSFDDELFLCDALRKSHSMPLGVTTRAACDGKLDGQWSLSQSKSVSFQRGHCSK